MTIGNNVYVGKYCTLQADIETGNNVDIANLVGLIGKYDHDFFKVGVSIKYAPWIGDPDYNFKGMNKKIVIGDDVWLGYGVVVVTGVGIGGGRLLLWEALWCMMFRRMQLWQAIQPGRWVHGFRRVRLWSMKGSCILKKLCKGSGCLSIDH